MSMSDAIQYANQYAVGYWSAEETKTPPWYFNQKSMRPDDTTDIKIPSFIKVTHSVAD